MSMITSKRLSAIVAVVLCLSLLLCGVLVYAAYIYEGTAADPEYQTKLFGEEILTIDIQTDGEDWQDLLDNAQAKEWISGDLLINGELFRGVGIRTKGNSSLSQGRMGGSSEKQRYSLQFSFDEYVKGQTCYGLDTFCVNNMMGDATYMKDYLAYEIMEYIGVAAPLRNYASVTVNGEDYGFFVALERYDESYLERTQGTSSGQLYNVKIAMGMREDFEGNPGERPQGNDEERTTGNAENADGEQPSTAQYNMAWGMRPGGGMGNRTPPENAEEFNPPEGFSPPEGFAPPGDTAQPSDGQPRVRDEASAPADDVLSAAADATAPGEDRRNVIRVGGGFGNRGGGGSLVYTDSSISSYNSIFDNAIFKKNSDKDKQRVITAIEKLNKGEDLEQYFDVDAILRYFAAHNTVVNLDSYSSGMQQNYYIYERNGKLTVLPWDYGLAFGGFQSGSASDYVNFPIDTPVSGVSMEERPLLNKLLEVDEYRERYHGYLQDIAANYLQGGKWEETITAMDAKIASYVETDATAYFTGAQYRESLPVFTMIGLLRAKSILGQLDGTIPSTTEGQREDSAALIAVSGINMNALGSMGGGMTRVRVQEENGEASPEEGEVPAGNMPEGGRMPGGFGGMDITLMREAMEILEAANFELTGEVKEQLLALGLTEEQIELAANMMGGGGFPGGEGGQSGRGARGGMPGQRSGTTAGNQNSAGYAIVFAALMLILAGAVAIVAWPRKNQI